MFTRIVDPHGVGGFRLSRADANPEGINQYSGAAGSAEKASVQANAMSKVASRTGETVSHESAAAAHQAASAAHSKAAR